MLDQLSWRFLSAIVLPLAAGCSTPSGSSAGGFANGNYLDPTAVDVKSSDGALGDAGKADIAPTDSAGADTGDAGAKADANPAEVSEPTDADPGSEILSDGAAEGDVDWSELLDPEDAGSGDAAGPDAAADAATDACPERAKIVYVVTSSKQLLSFTPDTLAFKPVGTLSCPGASTSQPFSMAVDRQANAYVLYSTALGQGAGVYKVSTLDASCQATPYQVGVQGFELFGMGFSADSPALPDEHLWIGGTNWAGFNTGSCKLGTLDTQSYQPQLAAMLPAGMGCPEVSGNGNAELFGFFPNASPPTVGRIHKTTGKLTSSWPLPAQAFKNIEAWAFAQWGGLLWLFFKTSDGSSSSVWTLNPQDGAVKMVVASTGLKIVGAGVSSCAPSKAVAP